MNNFNPNLPCQARDGRKVTFRYQGEPVKLRFMITADLTRVPALWLSGHPEDRAEALRICDKFNASREAAEA